MRTAAIAEAYSETGRAWQVGPGRMYDRLSEEVVGLSAVPIAGCVVLDVGTGTGAASRAVCRAGGRPIGLDAALGMLRVDQHARAPAAGADAGALPIRTGSVGGVVAAFSLNHLADPVDALREAVRVTERGGVVIVAGYADDDAQHPVKAAVHGALRAVGWREPAWYAEVRADAARTMGTPDACRRVARAAGLNAEVHARQVPFPHLGVEDLVRWRLGMAHVAPFVAGLRTPDRATLSAEAGRRLGNDWPVLVRSILVISGVA